MRGHWGWGLTLLGMAVANRLVEAWVVGWIVLRDKPLLKRIWLYPTRDLLGFIVWCASFAGTKIAWRNSWFELQGERMVIRNDAQDCLTEVSTMPRKQVGIWQR